MCVYLLSKLDCVTVPLPYVTPTFTWNPVYIYRMRQRCSCGLLCYCLYDTTNEVGNVHGQSPDSKGSEFDQVNPLQLFYPLASTEMGLASDWRASMAHQLGLLRLFVKLESKNRH